MIPGIKLTLADGKEYVIPPLTMGQLRNGVKEKLKKHDELLKAVETPESGVSGWDAAFIRAEIIGEALRRNYSDLTDDDIFGLINTANMAYVWSSILGLSGFDEQGNPMKPTDQSATPGT